MNKVSLSKEGDWIHFLWEGTPWKKIHTRFAFKELRFLYQAERLEEAEVIFFRLEKKAVLAFVINWLSKKGVFAEQIQDKLRSLGVAPCVIEETIVFCSRIGAINDKELLEAMQEREIRRGKGVKIALLKARRWIGPQEAKKEEMIQLEKEALIRFLQKKKIDFPTLTGEQKRKAIRILLQRGFAWETIQEVLSCEEIFPS